MPALTVAWGVRRCRVSRRCAVDLPPQPARYGRRCPRRRTFRRHFPDLAKEVSAARGRQSPHPAAEMRPSPYEVLAARNAKLRRSNRSLTENLQFAAAQIQRLAVDNACLREALEASSNVTHIDQPSRGRRS
ncbi:hypothetical protein OG782_37150 (plasmid) [Streptomyces sp. NBC_00876]|uniref:hypothetical protein n=1 Tax=Streptomyces sp. NBC_00876 TaxID=2975853 RepID=UPI00386A61F8|nr:hypothetical protein OG782_37150 [Streptomyces sp. NBC_00876]